MDQRDIENTDSDAMDEADCSTNLNKPINLADTEFQTHDECSQDLFDDTEGSAENSPSINFDSSHTARFNSPRITDLTVFTQTPKIGKEENSPCGPTIPTIPSSLVPFFSTVNESWNSELETPEAKTAAEMNQQCAERRDQLLKSCETVERRGGITDVTTPSGSFLVRAENEGLSTSPILNTMIKRRRPKRRILKSLIDTNVSMGSPKEITSVCHTLADDCVDEEIEKSESPPQNDTTFVVGENCSLNNTEVDVNDEEEGGESLMNKRLQSCEDSGEIGQKDTLKTEEETVRSSGGAEKVITDWQDAEYSMDKTEDKSLAELVKEIRELEENQEQVAEYKYADIPMEVFTRDAKALVNAEMIPIKAQNKSNVKRQWGLMSFTQMCLLENENCEDEDPDIKEIVKTESTIENREFSSDPENDKLITGKSAAISHKEDKDSEDISSSFVPERDEPVIDIDEFSPWFYQSNEVKAEFSNNTNTMENSDTEIATNQKTINCDTVGKIKNNSQLFVEGTVKNGEDIRQKMSSSSGNHPVEKKEKICINSPQLYSSMGFSTASGKPITISKEKIKRAAKLYNEIALLDEIPCDVKMLHDKTEDPQLNNNEKEETILRNPCGSMDFSAVGGKAIKISEDELKEAAKLYDELPLKDENQYDLKTLDQIPRDHAANIGENCSASFVQNSYCSMGFSTASGKPIKISENKLKKAAKLYDEIALQVEKDCHAKMLRETPGDQRTESKKNESTIVENSYFKSKEAAKLYETNLTDKLQPEIDLLKAPTPRGIKRKYKYDDIDSNKICAVGASMGFRTASGKPLIISDAAMKNAKMIYESINDLDSQLPEDIDSTKEPITSVGMGKNKSSMKNYDDTYKTDGKSTFASSFATASSTGEEFKESFMIKAKNTLNDGDSLKLQRFSSATAPSDIEQTEQLKLKNLPTHMGDVTVKAKKLLLTEQENTPPPKYSLKRSSTAMETSASSNALSSNKTPASKSLSENTLSDDTPLGVSIFQTSKRVRFNPELQARKLFGESGGDTDEETEHQEQFHKEYRNNPLTPMNSSKNHARYLLNHERNRSVPFTQNSTTGLYAKSEMFEANDRLMFPKLEAQKSWPLNQSAETLDSAGKFKTDTMRLGQAQKDRRISTYSDEITASTEALLADEENSLDGKLWASAMTCSPNLIKSRDGSVRPLTFGTNSVDVVQEVPASPKFRSKRKNKRSKKSVLKKDNEALEEQIVTQDSQQSSGVATPSSDSSKESNRNMNTVIESVLVSKLERLVETSTRIHENSVGVAPSEIDEKEAVDFFLENLLAATLKQEKQIRAKKKCKTKPISGSLLLRKMENRESRLSWRQATNGVPPKPRTASELMNLGAGSDVAEVTAATALDYRFKCTEFYSKDEIRANAYGLDTGDGSRLIFNGNGYAGVAEFELAFLASPGVDPTLVPLRWVENHYRWIVWKLASMDRMKYGDLLMPRMLTPRHVMEQLKYRYDREVDKSQRPALRRIIEKDDPPNRRMVLCVATITKLENIQDLEKSPQMSLMSHWKVELTDGWYSIKATIDPAMSHLIAFGKVQEGTKLVTCNAELLNLEQGCSPLEIPGEVSLKIHTNSTRRAKWDTKLGYCRHAGPIPTSISAILPNGGLIGKFYAIISRVYPTQYFEKTCSGQSIFRNNKCEDKAVMMYEKERQAQIDSIYAQVRAEFEAKNRKQSKTNSSALCSDSESYEQSYCNMSEEAFRSEVEAELRRSLPPPRKVTSVLKVRVMEGDNLAIITVWAPSEDIIDVLKEGNRVSIHNVQISGKRGGELQLTAGHRSFVKLEESNVSSYPRRCLTSIPEVAVAGFNPPFGEFDTVGIVVSLGPAPHGMKNFEVVNLAHPNPDPSSSAYLSILFWEGIGAHGFSDILSIGAIVACTNIQWRRGAPRTIPTAYSTEHSTFTRNPRQIYLRSAFDSVKSQITDPVTYVSQCAVEIAMEYQKKSTILRSPAVQGTPSNASPSAANLQDKFAAGMSPRTPQGLVTPGPITPAKYSIQKRLEKLQWYGEPPELSPITLNHSSMKVNSKFVPPARTPEHLECVNQRREINFKK